MKNITKNSCKIVIFILILTAVLVISRHERLERHKRWAEVREMCWEESRELGLEVNEEDSEALDYFFLECTERYGIEPETSLMFEPL